MIRTHNVGKHSLRLHARSKGEAVTLARVLNSGEQVRTIGPKDEGATGGSLLVVYTSTTARDAAVRDAKTAPTFTPVADVPTTEPELRELDADATHEGDETMATKTTAHKRPKRGAKKPAPEAKAAPKTKTKKKATPKKAAKKKKAGKKAAKKKAGKKTGKKAAPKKAAQKPGEAPRRGRPPGGGVGELVKTMLRAGKTDVQIVASVKRTFPGSAVVERPGPHLAWYRNRVKVEDDEKARK